MLCEWMKTNYVKRYYGQTLEVNEDVADRNQDGLMGQRKTQGNWVAEIGWRLPRVAEDMCLRTPRPTESCRAVEPMMMMMMMMMMISAVPTIALLAPRTEAPCTPRFIIRLH
jgi:hypothetical protein